MFVIPQLWIRVIGTVVCLVALFFFVCPLFVGIRHIGCYAGALASVLCGIFFAANPWVSAFLKKAWDGGTGHFLMCVGIGVVCLCCVLAVAISVGMIGAIHDKPKTENTLVVLGCKVKGTTPSLMLKRRLDVAAAYLKEHPEVPVIVCGGQGKDEGISEAQCMFDYLTAQGIDAGRITQENTSTSTYENLVNTRSILEKNGWEYKVTLVTDGYHQLRASMIAGSLHIDTDGLSAKTSWYLVPGYWVREWLGVCYQAVFG